MVTVLELLAAPHWALICKACEAVVSTVTVLVLVKARPTMVVESLNNVIWPWPSTVPEEPAVMQMIWYSRRQFWLADPVVGAAWFGPELIVVLPILTRSRKLGVPVSLQTPWATIL